MWNYGKNLELWKKIRKKNVLTLMEVITKNTYYVY